MGLEFGFWIAPNWSYIRKMAMGSQISDMTSSSVFFDVVFFLLSGLLTGPSFVSTSSLVLKLRQFFFIRN